MGAENVQPIFISLYIVNITQSVQIYLSRSQHDYKWDTDVMQQFKKQEVNIKRLTF